MLAWIRIHSAFPPRLGHYSTLLVCATIISGLHLPQAQRETYKLPSWKIMCELTLVSQFVAITLMVCVIIILASCKRRLGYMQTAKAICNCMDQHYGSLQGYHDAMPLSSAASSWDQVSGLARSHLPGSNTCAFLSFLTISQFNRK